MKEIRELVDNYKLVLENFREWPSFHDAEVIDILLVREETKIVMKINVTEQSTSNNYEKATITFGFYNVEDLELYGFNHQNVIAGISLNKEKEKIKVEILSCYGIGGRFFCERIEVINVDLA